MIMLSVLTHAEIEAIHASTLRILDETGVVLAHPEGREMLTAAGASIEGDRVLLPPDLVESALARCTGIVQLYGRTGNSIVLGDGTLHWHNMGGGAISTIPTAAGGAKPCCKTCATARA